MPVGLPQVTEDRALRHTKYVSQQYSSELPSFDSLGGWFSSGGVSAAALFESTESHV